MKKNFAIIINGVISNIVMILENDFNTIMQLGAIAIPEGVDAKIGYLYDDGIFTDPNPPATPITTQIVEPELTYEQIESILAELAAESKNDNTV